MYHQNLCVRALLASTCAGVLLGGCALSQSPYENVVRDNKITVAETVERMELYVQPTTLNLSARDQDAVGNFVAQYSRTGQGPLYLNVPKNIAGGNGVREARTMLMSHLTHLGISANVVQMGQYVARDGVSAPVVVSYRRLATAPINCQQGNNLVYTSHNKPFANYGCAHTANLAALVTDPRQFLSPYDLAPADANRRALMVGKFTNGEATGTERPAGQEAEN